MSTIPNHSTEPQEFEAQLDYLIGEIHRLQSDETSFPFSHRKEQIESHLQAAIRELIQIQLLVTDHTRTKTHYTPRQQQSEQKHSSSIPLASLQAHSDKHTSEAGFATYGIDSAQSMEDVYEKIALLSSDGIMITFQGIIQHANQALIKLLDYTNSQELQGKVLFERIHPTYIPLLELHQQLAEQGKEVTKVPIQMLSKDGSTLGVEVSIMPVPYRQKQAFFFTIRKQEKKGQYSAGVNTFSSGNDFLLNEAPAIVYAAAPKYPLRITHISANVETIMGYTPEEFLDTPSFMDKHIHPDDLQMLNDDFPLFLEHTILKLEYRFRFADGNYHWLYDQFRLTYDGTGQVNGIVGCLIDITDKKQAEARLNTLLQKTQAMNDSLRHKERELLTRESEYRAREEDLRRQLEQTLEIKDQLFERERFHKLIISNATEGILVLDRELNCQVWNPFLEKRTGLFEHEVTGKHITDMFPALEELGILQLLHKALAGETHSLTDAFFPFFGSEGLWVKATFSPLVNQQQHIIGVISSFTDITDRRQAEQALVEQTNRLKAFNQSVPHQLAIFELKDDDFTFKLFNQPLADYFGLSAERMVDTNARHSGIHHQIVSDWHLLMKRCLEEGTTLQVEYPLQRETGVDDWFFTSFTPINAREIAFCAINITPYKEAEQALQDQFKLLQSFYDSVPFHLLLIKLQPDDYVVEFFNRHTADYFGIPFQERNDKTIKLSGFHPENKEEWLNSMRSCIQLGKPVYQEYVYPAYTDGKELLHLCCFSPVNNQTVSVTAIDISQQKLAEEEKNQLLSQAQALNLELEQSQQKLLEQQENLEKKNQLDLSTLLKGNPDALKAPLTSLLGLVGVTRQDTEESHRQIYLDLMEKSISRFDALFRELLSHQEDKPTKSEYEKIDLQALIMEILDELKSVEGNELIEKRIEIEQSIPFYSDAVQLKLICKNLLFSIIKSHTDLREPGFIQVKVTVNQEITLFEFKDDSKSVINKKEKGSHALRQASDASLGSELELYLVEEVVQALHGKITVQSQKRGGPVFSIEIPNHAAVSS